MTAIRCRLVSAAINKASSLTDFNIHNDIHKIFEFRKKTILADESLTKVEKSKSNKSNKIIN